MAFLLNVVEGFARLQEEQDSRGNPDLGCLREDSAESLTTNAKFAKGATELNPADMHKGGQNTPVSPMGSKEFSLTLSDLCKTPSNVSLSLGPLSGVGEPDPECPSQKGHSAASLPNQFTSEELQPLSSNSPHGSEAADLSFSPGRLSDIGEAVDPFSPKGDKNGKPPNPNCSLQKGHSAQFLPNNITFKKPAAATPYVEHVQDTQNTRRKRGRPRKCDSQSHTRKSDTKKKYKQTQRDDGTWVLNPSRLYVCGYCGNEKRSQCTPCPANIIRIRCWCTDNRQHGKWIPKP